jgi:hypothetical protein
MKTRGACLFLIVCSALAAAAQHVPAGTDRSLNGPGCRPTASGISIPHATPGGVVYLAGVTLASAYYDLSIDEHLFVLHAGDDGRASLDNPSARATRGVWLAVDANSGGYTVAPPQNFLLREADLPADALIHDSGSTLPNCLRLARASITVVVVRPDGGMWSGAFRDGDRDADGTVNGQTAVRLTDLAAVGSGPRPPDSLRTGDVLFVVDRNSLEFIVSRIP